MNKGDYVRTPNGVIARIIDIQDEEGQYFLNSNVVSLSSKVYISDKNITIGENFKHSSNIIDLIKVGDYVNGYLVEDVGNTFLNIATGSNYFQKPTIFENDIKSIVTKEQFEAIEYKVESEVK